MRLLRPILLALTCLIFAGALHAQFVLTPLFDTSTFSGSTQVLDFNAIGNEVPITGQYASSGVDFAGGLFGMTNSGDLATFPANGGGGIASSWLYSQSGPVLPWTATFAVTQSQVGFLVEMNFGDSVQITTFLGGVSHGSISQVSTSSNPAFFFGVSDSAGFDSISVTVTGSSNHFLALDDFRFDAIPEPSVLLMLGLGLPLLGLAARWRGRHIGSGPDSSGGA